MISCFKISKLFFELTKRVTIILTLDINACVHGETLVLISMRSLVYVVLHALIIINILLYQ